MKILGLDLKAFGLFTEKLLDLSRGQEGFHIIYGLNEAGKSTALRALEALFYGIDHQTGDSFLHENQNIRIGGHIRHSDKSELAFIRRKGRKNTLLDTEEKPIADSILHKYLANVTREMFSSLFGINHDTLTRGGMQLVDGGGDLGESLFAAGTGITDLRNIARSLQNEAEEIFKPRGSTQRINRLVIDYKDAGKKSKALSLSSREWVSHEKTLNEAVHRRKEVRKRLNSLRSDKSRYERLKEALPIITEKMDLSARLDALKDIPLLDPAFPDDKRSAIRELEKARSEANMAAEDLKVIDGQIEDLSVPEDIISHAKVITELHKRLGSHLKADQDLPKLKGELETLEADAEKILAELRPGLTLKDAEGLRLTKMKREMILDLGSQFQALQRESIRTSETLDELEADYKKAKDKLDGLDSPLDCGELKSTIRRVHKYGDLEEELRIAGSRLKTEERKADAKLKALPLWTGTLEELEATPVPASETIDHFLIRFDELSRKVTDITNRIEEKEEERDNLDKEIQALQIAGSVPTEQELMAERRRRDHGWCLVRRQWIEKEDIKEEGMAFDHDLPLDKAYEKSVSRADEVADRLRRESKRVEKLAQLLASHDKCHKKLEALKEKREMLLHKKSALEGEWDAHWEEAGIKPLSPKEMTAWQNKQGQLISKAAIVRERGEDVARTKGLMEKSKEALGRCIGKLGMEELRMNESLNAMLDRYQTVVDEIERIERACKDAEKTMKDLGNKCSVAERKHIRARENLAEWYESWGEAVIELGLPVETTSNQANAFIAGTRELFDKIDRADGIKTRIEDIKRDAEHFGKKVRGILDQVAQDLLEFSIYHSSEELNTRLIKAKEDLATLKQLKKRRKEKDRTVRKAKTTIREMTDKLEAMCRKAGCSDYDEMDEIALKSVEKRKTEDLVRQLESQLQRVSHGGGMTTDELIHKAEEVNHDELTVIIGDLEHGIAEEEDLLSELDNTIGGEERELKQMDGSAGAAEAAEEGQGILSMIRGQAEQYMHLRMASAILNLEMERYREANQDPILRRASEVFSQLTSVSFSGLKPSYDHQDNPILLGVRPTGEEVTVAGMSDGTCDQLYLSLRLASLERHLEKGETLPFIIDDILINFDDNRAKATLQALAALSKKTQIIFFTHHRHLLELARAHVEDGVLFTHTL